MSRDHQMYVLWQNRTGVNAVAGLRDRYRESVPNGPRLHASENDCRVLQCSLRPLSKPYIMWRVGE
ncbi:MAG: hypothetical protein IH830_06500 [Planctomycetes bacterium]|nr:hypothetical protein [Planctomycetota bacterium]